MAEARTAFWDQSAGIPSMYTDPLAWNTAVETLMEASISKAAYGLLHDVMHTITANPSHHIDPSSSHDEIARLRRILVSKQMRSGTHSTLSVVNTRSIWNVTPDSRRRAQILGCIVKTCSESELMAASRLYCDEIKLNSLMDDDGAGFLRLLYRFYRQVRPRKADDQDYDPIMTKTFADHFGEAKTCSHDEYVARQVITMARNSFICKLIQHLSLKRSLNDVHRYFHVAHD